MNIFIIIWKSCRFVFIPTLHISLAFLSINVPTSFTVFFIHLKKLASVPGAIKVTENATNKLI